MESGRSTVTVSAVTSELAGMAPLEVSATRWSFPSAAGPPQATAAKHTMPRAFRLMTTSSTT